MWASTKNEWAKTSAKWLAEKLGGKGNIVEIEGFPGHPANVARMSGVDEVLANYPDIKVLGKDTGKWDEATGQQVMSNFLASFPNLDGYWTQDGMAIGAMQALMAANPAKWPVAVGEGRCQFLSLWDRSSRPSPISRPSLSPTPGRLPDRPAYRHRHAAGQTGGHLQAHRPVRAQVHHPNPGGGDQGQLPAGITSTCADKPPAYLLDGIMSEARYSAVLSTSRSL